MRTIYFGTGDIGLPALELLAGRPDIDLVAVVTGPDKPVGRHQTLTPPETKSLAARIGIPVFQPAIIAQVLPDLTALGPDLFVVMAYGALLPQAVLDAPRTACINLHASLLPRHRGASPIQSAIAAGDRQSGVTVMHISPGLDEGDIILQRPLDLDPAETGGSLHEKLAQLAPLALGDALDALVAGTPGRHPQDPSRATYLGKLTRADGRLDWSRPAAQLERLVRAYDPWPGTTAMPGPPGSGDRLPRCKIFPPTIAEPGPDGGTADPGTVTAASPDRGIVVSCGGGTTLTLTEIQPEGKRRMPVADFLAGHRVAPGTTFA